MDFRQRITAQRPYTSQVRQEGAGGFDLDQLIAQLESDRGRIINSPAIRRLQQKTQVFPLEHNAAVRSRLTHSMEVQQNGRFIVRTLYQLLGERAAEYGLQDLQGAVESLVEMACLAHDIGNPPFGHFGESAITDWFTRHLDALFPSAGDSDQALLGRLKDDLRAFEGNAQTVRLVVHLMRLNLTYSQTACLLKYLRPAYAAKPKGVYLQKKPGFYLSEESFVAEMTEALGMAPGCRFPLTYIMEAADDISYCLADIEDSVEKGIFDIEQLAGELIETFAAQPEADVDAPIPTPRGRPRSFRQIVKDALKRAQGEAINPASEFFIWLRVGLIHPLVQHAAGQFAEHLEAVRAGTLNRALLEDKGQCHAIIETFKGVAARRVYCHPEVETLLLQGHRIIQGVLDAYHPLLCLEGNDFHAMACGERAGSHLQRMLLARLPNQQKRAYIEAMKTVETNDWTAWEFYYRCRLLQDFVSGMTDQQAEDEYRTLSALP